MTSIAEYDLRDKLTLHPPTTNAEHIAIALRMLAADIASGLPEPFSVSIFRHERLRLQFRPDDLAAWLARYHVREPEWRAHAGSENLHAHWPAIAWGGMPFEFVAVKAAE